MGETEVCYRGSFSMFVALDLGRKLIYLCLCNDCDVVCMWGRYILL